MYPPQGIGQGNGARPQVWGITSSGMLQILHDKGLSTNIITPISKVQLELCGFTFVNDSDLIADAGYTNNPELTMKRIQTTIDTWEGVEKKPGE